MTIRIYNTLTRKKEDFETIEPDKVRMYVCGPTVYDDAHVGHAMSAVVFDIIRRYLTFRGYDVCHVMNFTDVDDKIIKRANEMSVDPFVLAEEYIQQFNQHLSDLNVLPPTITPRATQEIDHIIAMNQALIDKGFAYEAEGDVYYRVERLETYGKLSGRKIEDMQAGARIEVDDRKENPMDFALWKAAKSGEPAWDSPWGQGRPGWHIECSAMSMNHLGDQIDIHGGGNDLIFPHHENEIAQTESLTNKPFSRFWIHNGMLQLEGEKMSKSLGNLITIHDFLDENDPDVFRLIILNGSYRGPVTFTAEVIQQGKKALARLRSALKPAHSAEFVADAAERLLEQVKATREGFTASMDDDFNTAGALGHLFDLIRVINQSRDQGIDQESLQLGQETLLELTGVMGLQIDRAQSAQAIEPLIDLLLDIRAELRIEKLWALSDQIRDRLKVLGITIEDTKDGSIWYVE